MPAHVEKYQSKFLREVEARGFIHQCTDAAALDALLTQSETAKAPVVCYIGFDCTAPSLHVGSLIQIMMLRHWQKAGHKPIVLMGGGTTKIGDPTGKDQARAMLSDEKIEENMAGIRSVFSQFLTFGNGPTDAVMVNNADWLRTLNYVDFMTEYGRLFSMNRMLSMESVKQRLERESYMSLLEFNYMVMQAYDYTQLKARFGCRVQMGGSDQWGNIVAGVDLGDRLVNTTYDHIKTMRESGSADLNIDPLWQDVIDAPSGQLAQEAFLRIKEQAALFGLTTPLLATASGVKMGKTVGGAVWLNADMFSVHDYWQFWRNVEDADVGRFMRLFTELPLDEIARLEALPGQEINEAKKTLATEATALLHGREAAMAAAETARQTFEQGVTAESLPEVEIEVGEGIAAFQLLVAAGLVASGGEARRLIAGGGARLNDQKIDEATRLYTREELHAMQPVKLSSGKKKHVKIALR